VAERHTFQVEPADAGQRLDHFLTARLPQYSRARLQEWIDAGRIKAGGSIVKKASHKIRAAECIEVDPVAAPPLRAFAQDIPLTILYEDDDVVAVDKPAGMVVHLGAGRHEGTLVNALLHRYGSLSRVGEETRPGIVHRIDRGTSGVLLVARTDAAHRSLAAQFASRQVEKIYLALVHGTVKQESGRIDAPIMRDPIRRTRMTAKLEAGRPALTTYRVLRRFPQFTYLEVRIGTGRTHQIRVHLSSIGHPIAGDTLYGAAARVAGMPELGRPFLHAHSITFRSPSRDEPVTLVSPLAPELAAWLERL